MGPSRFYFPVTCFQFGSVVFAPVVFGAVGELDRVDVLGEADGAEGVAQVAVAVGEARPLRRPAAVAYTRPLLRSI